MILEMILLTCAGLLLLYAAWFDFKNKLVEYWVVVVLLVLGLIYLCFCQDIVETLAVLFFTVFIWGLPTFFGFGFGDFLLFVGLSFFIPDVGSMWLFYGVFLVIWIVWTFVFFVNEREKLSLRRMCSHEYPLVPVIMISFYVWIGLGGIV